MIYIYSTPSSASLLCIHITYIGFELLPNNSYSILKIKIYHYLKQNIAGSRCQIIFSDTTDHMEPRKEDHAGVN